MGCHDGVRMDDDEYHEGWQSDTIYPPCPHSPWCCKDCGGDGRNRNPQHDSDDCAACSGTGWKEAMPQWPIASTEEQATMTDEQVKHMVDRFLGWRLPENFNPDGGISFQKTHSERGPFGPQKYEPSGTNLFDATQADAMVRYMIDGLPGNPDAVG
jgi:hypothetical protein